MWERFLHHSGLELKKIVNFKQRPSKVPIHYRHRLNKLLIELEKYNIIKQIGSTPDEKHTIGTTFLHPLIIIPKGDAIKVVLDARHLNSNPDQEFESWPIEPLAPQLARANKKYKSTINLMCAYAHTPPDVFCYWADAE